jgi:hypothetical protein
MAATHLRENPMLAEHPSPQPMAEAVDASLDAPMDVVVLVVPDHGLAPGGLSYEFLDAIAQMRARGDAAILVVFPRTVEPEVFARAEGAGASHCVVAPTSVDVFRHIERARTLRRHPTPTDESLDALWRTRPQHR